MQEPLDNEYDDPPCTRDAEVLRLKADVLALRVLLMEASRQLQDLRSHILFHDAIVVDLNSVEVLRNKIDAELNG